MSAALPFSLLRNPNHGTPGMVTLPEGGFRRARTEITGWPGYAATPLHDLPALAHQAGVACVRIKDEAGRFGLGSFKALGGAYAVAQVLALELSRAGVRGPVGAAALSDGTHASTTAAVVVTCATDGNHGRSVAWGAQRFGCRCVIFVHAAVSQARIDAIAAYGAEIQVTPGTYDDAVRAASAAAQANGWRVVSDTSWPSYMSVPVDIMQGYRLMADEALDQWQGDGPTHAFIQAGVGGVAAAVSVQLRQRCTAALIVVEPDRAACLLASARAGRIVSVPGALDTIMAGLACGEPSLLAWQELERAASAFMAIPDEAAVQAMRLLARDAVVSGESGAAGLAGLLLAAGDGAARAALGLGASSRVLLFSTEGATDAALYARLVGPAAAISH
jgi:diaminopropionate ammonia-lyase